MASCRGLAKVRGQLSACSLSLGEASPPQRLEGILVGDVGKAVAPCPLSKHKTPACLSAVAGERSVFSKAGEWLTFLFSLSLFQGSPHPLAFSIQITSNPKRAGKDRSPPQPQVLPSMISFTCSQLRSEYMRWKVPERNNGSVFNCGSS